MSIYAIYFSPTGRTEKTVKFIAEQFGDYQTINLCERTINLTNDLKEILYLIFDYPHKHYTFKYFEV